LEEIKADQWAKLRDANAKPLPRTIPMTDDRWKDFQQGKIAIYVLYAAKFEDEGHRQTSHWSVRQCMFFRGAVTFHHNCDVNRTELVAKPRH
jgi:hypothetical protein